ncbi:MAG: L-aspartate oxidase [Cyanobacteria bacterium REEB67]|nr:L-aspartate oxidase [Cyanobacteria bacterium REEB67]
MKTTGIKKTDVLILGSGLAGLLLALSLLENSEAALVLVCKAGLSDSNSSWAQGGVAAVTGANPFDSPQIHYEDTLKSGAGLTDPRAAAEIIFSGGRLIEALDHLGVAFDRNPQGLRDLALEGGHRQPRVLHSKDTTGRSITSALVAKLISAQQAGKNITILENTQAVRLLCDDKRCYGAELLSETGLEHWQAAHTVLATGGLGQVFARTTNPVVATGDGVALAHRGGANLADMEFVQFHPTALRLDGAPAFLISEAVRGAGAILLDHKGRRFVKRFHEDGELATRDVVSRAIHTVMSEHELNEVFLDLRPIGAEKIKERFPNIVKSCAQYGIDVLRAPVPVAPAAHYMMGGVQAAVDGRTSLTGLYAIGEVACTGLHGANRLASNSLLEAGVMALRLADLLKDVQLSEGMVDFAALPQLAAVVIPDQLEAFRRAMYRQAGLVRSASGLSAILDYKDCRLQSIENAAAHDFTAANIFLVGRLIAAAALSRRESRGAHLRDDFQETAVHYNRVAAI